MRTTCVRASDFNYKNKQYAYTYKYVYVYIFIWHAVVKEILMIFSTKNYAKHKNNYFV